MRLVREWVQNRRAELLANWDRASRREPLEQIPGADADLVKIVKVEPQGGYRLRVAFSNGDAGARDLSDLISESGSMVEPLRDTAFFARVFLQHGVLAWPNGFDLDAIALHQEMAAAATLKRASAVS